MQDFEIVKTVQPFDDLDYNLPNVLLLHKLLVVLALADALEHVSIVRKLHDDTENYKIVKSKADNLP